MTEIFNRSFEYTIPELLQDLITLQMEGAIYSYKFYEDDFVYTCLRLNSEEMVDYVDAATAYEDFLRYCDTYNNEAEALNHISQSRIKRRVEEYNEWAESIDLHDSTYCFAAFLGKDLESLVCSIVPGRTEIIGQTYTGDRRFLLREVLTMFPQAVGVLGNRGGNRPNYPVEEEQDVRDLLFGVIKCIFTDAKLEEFTPSHAGNTKRIDIVIPMIQTVIETKYVRDTAHARRVADELKIDFESYYVHPNCQTLIAYVWDPKQLLRDRSNFIKDLQGLRYKGERQFRVEVIVQP